MINVQTTWYDAAPQSVRFSWSQTLAARIVPDDTTGWTLSWVYTDADDMEIVGYCAAGYCGELFYICTQSLDFPVLMAAVAACTYQLPTHNEPVACFTSETATALEVLGIQCKLFTRLDDGLLRVERDNNVGLHDAPPALCDLPLAGDTEGEET